MEVACMRCWYSLTRPVVRPMRYDLSTPLRCRSSRSSPSSSILEAACWGDGLNASKPLLHGPRPEGLSGRKDKVAESRMRGGICQLCQAVTLFDSSAITFRDASLSARVGPTLSKAMEAPAPLASSTSRNAEYTITLEPTTSIKSHDVAMSVALRLSGRASQSIRKTRLGNRAAGGGWRSLAWQPSKHEANGLQRLAHLSFLSWGMLSPKKTTA